MKRDAQYFILTAVIAAVAGLLSGSIGPVFAQGIAPAASAGAPHDWSHRHLIYSNVDTRDEVTRKGYRAFEEWQHRNKDPRFTRAVARKGRFIQVARERENSPQQIWTPSPFSREPQHQWTNRHRKDPRPTAPDIQRDWSNVLGGATGVGKAGVFPAKFGVSFDTAECVGDFVVYTTASLGVAGSGALATQNGRFNGAPSNGQTVTITNGTRSLVLTASTTVGSNTGLTFQVLGTGGNSAALRATNLANAINRNGGTVGVTAIANTTAAGGSGRVRVTSITHGTGSNNITLAETLNGFTWNGNLAGGSGTAGQPTIIAFNQLYKTTCGTASTPVPAALWSYNTGTNAVTETSPVLSLDGTQVAFIQRTGAVASLVLLKWSSASPGTVGAPTIPASATLAGYRDCTAPCMTVIALNGDPNNTNSSPYYVYYDDVLYVGDDGGKLHKFTGVFNGAPAEVTSDGWPVSVSSGNRKLSSPVYDYQSGKVFVGSAADASTGGQLYSVTATNPSVVNSAQLSAFNASNSGGVADSPIVDSSAQKVYAFVGADNSTACNNSPCAAVYQFDTGFTGGSGSKQQVGNGDPASTKLYAGSFDEAYYASTNYTGSLYVCGSLTNASRRPTVWRINLSSNAMASATEGFRISNNDSDCSPVTMMTNGGSEYVYLSVTANGIMGTCSGACLYMWDLRHLATTYSTDTQPNASLAAPGGTSGIIVDNASSTAGASQIYYSTLVSPGNAIQASQAGLQ